ncbi:MAG: FAD-dependent oxidoreductase [Brevinema sp.]
MKKVVVIGGVAGGAGVATRIKRLCEDCEVIVIEKGNFVSFANCGLPYHIGKKIPRRDQLILQNPKTLKARSDIEVRILHEALSISRDKKELQVKDLTSGEIYTESYDTLVLATGAKAIIPPVDGVSDSRVKTLQTIADMDGIISLLGDSQKHVAVVGGGFIGLETAENLIEAGHRVSLIEQAPQVMTSLDAEMSAYVEEELLKHGVSLYLNHQLNQITPLETGLRLKANDTEIDVDFVVLAVGVSPNSGLAEQAGISLNQRKAIIVDDYLCTSDPSIYAVGDVIETYNIATGKRGTVPLAGPATRQARIAAANILGATQKYTGINPTSICKVFSLTVASTGANEKELQEQSYHKIYVHPSNHPGYYPKADQMHIKLLYNADGVILGAQIIGGEGVDKRTDIFALAVRQKLNVYDLSEQDFAYAPPFGSPRDPVHVVSFAAINQLEGRSHPVFNVDEDNSILLDVREPSEVAQGAVKNSIHIPLGELRKRYQELDSTKPVVVMCASGLRSYLAERLLSQKGFTVSNYSGGYTCLRISNLTH